MRIGSIDSREGFLSKLKEDARTAGSLSPREIVDFFLNHGFDVWRSRGNKDYTATHKKYEGWLSWSASRPSRRISDLVNVFQASLQREDAIRIAREAEARELSSALQSSMRNEPLGAGEAQNRGTLGITQAKRTDSTGIARRVEASYPEPAASTGLDKDKATGAAITASIKEEREKTETVHEGRRIEAERIEAAADNRREEKARARDMRREEREKANERKKADEALRASRRRLLKAALYLPLAVAMVGGGITYTYLHSAPAGEAEVSREREAYLKRLYYGMKLGNSNIAGILYNPTATDVRNALEKNLGPIVKHDLSAVVSAQLEVIMAGRNNDIVTLVPLVTDYLSSIGRNFLGSGARVDVIVWPKFFTEQVLMGTTQGNGRYLMFYASSIAEDIGKLPKLTPNPEDMKNIRNSSFVSTFLGCRAFGATFLKISEYAKTHEGYMAANIPFISFVAQGLYASITSMTLFSKDHGYMGELGRAELEQLNRIFEINSHGSEYTIGIRPPSGAIMQFSVTVVK